MAKPREMRSKRWLGFFMRLGVIVFSAWFSGKTICGALAQENPRELVEGKTAEGFRYMSGGVGSEERATMEGRAREYNLRLAFAAKSGPYISDVTLLIQDEKGKEIINTVTNGPWFFIDLPPGTYSVKATFDGQVREIKSLRLVKGKSARRYFYWEVKYGPRPPDAPG